MTKPRILIGVPAFQGVVPEAQENFFQLAFFCGKHLSADYDFLIRIVLKKEQFRARNSLIDMAIGNDCDWLLMLDDDMIVPPDLVERLLAHEKDLVGALYYQRGGAYHPVIMQRREGPDGLQGGSFYLPSDPIITEPGLYPVDVIGGGCMLFRVAVFAKLMKPYFWVDGSLGTDIAICTRLKEEQGVQPYIDTSIELGHISEPAIVTSRTFPRYAQRLGEVRVAFYDDLRHIYQMPTDELQGLMVRASEKAARQDAWHEKPRRTYDDIYDYYCEGGDWAVFNLAYFNLMHDAARDFVLTEIDRLCKPGGLIIDYGAGLGFLSIPLAQQGYQVEAFELEDSPLKKVFMKRLERHPGLSVDLWEIGRHVVDIVSHATYQKVYKKRVQQADGALLISVIDHLYDPWKVIDWLYAALKPGGFLVCDTWMNEPNAEEPQHLCRQDAHHFLAMMRQRHWRPAPDNPFLFFKE